MTNPNMLLNQGTQAGTLPSDFHECRVRFNRSFLSEDLEYAGQACSVAQNLADLDGAEKEELARWLLMLGRIDEALAQLSDILSEDPKNHSAALQKARILRLHHVASDYLEFINSRLESFPDHRPYYLDCRKHCRDNDDREQAGKLEELAAANGVLLPSADRSAAESNPGDDAQTSDFSEADLLTMLRVFRGRENCHARQWISDDGKHGYNPVHEPLNINHLRNHLLGIQAIGVYQLDLANRVNWIVFDLDLNKSHLDDLHDQDFRLWLENGYQRVTSNFRAVLRTYGLEMNLEFSGYKGYHIWILLEEPVSAKFARSLAQRIAAQVSLENLPLGIEIFPKQTRASAANYGNLVKLPYGIHRLTGLPSSMLDEDGKLIGFQDFVRNANKVSASTFLSALYSLDPDIVNVSVSAEPGQEDGRTEDAIEIGADPETDPEWLCLKENCQALWKLDSMVQSRSELTAGQKNVLRYTCGYLKNGPAIVNSLLRRLPGYDSRDLMRSAFRGNSMGCPKIRLLLGDLLEKGTCNCEFGDAQAMYPTPLLHLKQLEDRRPAPLRENDLKLREMVSNYLKLKKDSQTLSERLSEAETDILTAFADAGVDAITTPYGVLTRSGKPDDASLVLKLK